jgi:hypothetical protein
MAQIQGSKTSAGGRLDGSNTKNAVTSAAIALGVGWGDGTLVKTVASGSNDQRGSVAVQSVGANQAQATADVTLTYVDGAYESTPFGIVNLNTNDNAITERQPTAVVTSTTALAWRNSVLPVATKIYTFGWFVVA